MADYTDIDNQVEAAARALWATRTSELWDERLLEFPDSQDIAKARADAHAILSASGIVAELVGLRTEVDQLRNTFIGDPKCSGCAGGGLVWSGAEYAGTREYVSCPDCEGTGVAPPGLYGTVRSLLSNLSDVHAERDALQARRDAVTALHVAGEMQDHREWDCTCGFSEHRARHCKGCGYCIDDEGEYDRGIHNRVCPTVAALGVDPQKDSKA